MRRKLCEAPYLKARLGLNFNKFCKELRLKKKIVLWEKEIKGVFFFFFFLSPRVTAHA